MLLVGGLCGFVARPLMKASPATTVNLPAALQPTSVSQPTSTSSSEAALDIDNTSPADVMMQGLINQTRHFRGSPDAPVTIIIFSDFQCSYCGQFATDVGKRLENEYVWTGAVRFGYWQMAFLGDESQWAAEASECADEQGAFGNITITCLRAKTARTWALLSLIISSSTLRSGLNTEKFNECLDSGPLYTDHPGADQPGPEPGRRNYPLVHGQWPAGGRHPTIRFFQADD
jgi:protein-disulfide isomerase